MTVNVGLRKLSTNLRIVLPTLPELAVDSRIQFVGFDAAIDFTLRTQAYSPADP